jgi:L-gulonate 3-dehydrogenase
VVSPQDLDKTLKDGLGLRWSFIGPFETIELNAPGGIADYCKRYTGFYRSLSADPARPDVWDEGNVSRILEAWGGAPSADTLACRSVWRDKRLAALRAHKKSQPEA